MRVPAVLLTSLLFLAGATSATAGNWSWFHGGDTHSEVPREPEKRKEVPVEAPPSKPFPDRSSCVSQILKAQEKYGIPNNILLGIGLQETGHRASDGNLTVWPWSANAAGEGRWFTKRDEAIRWVEAKLKSGVNSVDVGCMQINLRWHPTAFNSVAEGFTPELNVEYAARLLLRLRKQTGSWELAAGSYHSFTPKYRNRYLKSLRKKIAFANQKVGEFRRVAQIDRASHEKNSRIVMNKVASPTPSEVVSPKEQSSAGLWSSGGNQGGSASLFSNGKISPLFGGN